jgi:hypothetical protein
MDIIRKVFEHKKKLLLLALALLGYVGYRRMSVQLVIRVTNWLIRAHGQYLQDDSVPPQVPFSISL